MRQKLQVWQTEFVRVSEQYEEKVEQTQFKIRRFLVAPVLVVALVIEKVRLKGKKKHRTTSI